MHDAVFILERDIRLSLAEGDSNTEMRHEQERGGARDQQRLRWRVDDVKHQLTPEDG